jgi:hypothetical protein
MITAGRATTACAGPPTRAQQRLPVTRRHGACPPDAGRARGHAARGDAARGDAARGDAARGDAQCTQVRIPATAADAGRQPVMPFAKAAPAT